MTTFLKRRMLQVSAAIVSSVPTPDDDILQQVWDRIRQAHPAVPDAEIRAVPGRRGSADTSVNKDGEVTGVNWSDSRPLILVGARTIEEGPASVLNFLLHMAAHGATPGGGVGSGFKGRWHTNEWRANAERFGLEVSGSAQSITTLVEWVGRHQYASELELLSRLSS